MNLRVPTSFIVLSFWVVGNSWAITKECLQAPSRTSSCPHLIYKRAALAVPSLGIAKHQVICICLSDINRNFNPQSNTVENIKQQVSIQRMAINYGLSEEEIVKLVKN
ncbi:hypothetical protein [Paraglaciecola marina]|uniref:hypothetical protein n=1 Tax=Paraglaciecola marina TaxID=2500157 RepID=UPI00105DA284|nr:hypothetical protein [Paraglaciecola marina]